MPVTVTTRDTGMKRLIGNLKYLSTHAVEVGMMDNHDREGTYMDPMRHPMNDDQTVNTDMTVADVLIQHEFGLGVPKRPPMSTVFDGNPAFLNKPIEKNINKMFTGRKAFGAKQALDGIADGAITELQNAILGHIPPPISFQRVLEKQKWGRPGHPVLVMHGIMINSFTSKQVANSG